MWRSDDGAVVLGAVSDGHGSEESMRSHVGSRLAVEAARRVVRDQEALWMTATSERLPGRAASISDSVVALWRRLVAQDLLRNPLSPHEMDGLGEEERTRVVMAPARAYGTTLLMAVMTDSWVVCATIGDGDILLVDAAGGVPAFGEDERFIANETASLCMPWAEREFRVRVVNQRQSPKRLVLLCTDGVSNAFRTSEGYYKLGSDLLDEAQERSCEEILQDLPGWLDEISSEGSGDDVTLCMIVAGVDGEVEQCKSAATGRPRTELVALADTKTEPCAPPASASGRPVSHSFRELILSGASRLSPFSTKKSKKSSKLERGES